MVIHKLSIYIKKLLAIQWFSTENSLRVTELICQNKFSIFLIIIYIILYFYLLLTKRKLFILLMMTEFFNAKYVII